MEFLKYYQPQDMQSWQGRKDAPANSAFFQIINSLNLSTQLPAQPKAPTFALLGFCCDEGIKRNLGRIGAAEGPAAIRIVFGPFALPAMPLQIVDAGNIICPDGDLEATQMALAHAVRILLQQAYTPIILGGGHELAWGNYHGIVAQYPQKKLAIVNFDAHFDMRPTKEGQGTSGTPFLQIAELAKADFHYYCIGIQPTSNTQALFNTAAAHHTTVRLAAEVSQNETLNLIQKIIADNDLIYVSLCLDVFAAPFAPGVSAPQALGVLPWQIIPLVRQLAASGKVVSYDIAELSPPFDIDARTAKLAANFIYEMMTHHKGIQCK